MFNMKTLNLAAENYDDIPLYGDVDVDVDVLNAPVQCESHDGKILEVTCEPPFRYLGVGRDKVVISGLVHGLDAIIGESNPVSAAIALARKNRHALGRLGSSLHGYRRLREHVPTAPTYKWYLGSLDEQVLVMPNLTENGGIVAAQNDRVLSSKKVEKLQATFDDIVDQLKRFIDGLPTGVYVTFDTYFVILGENSSQLFLGDFDNMAVSYGGPSYDCSVHNRRQAEHWLECIHSYLPRGDYRIPDDFHHWVHQHELPPL